MVAIEQHVHLSFIRKEAKPRERGLKKSLNCSCWSALYRQHFSEWNSSTSTTVCGCAIMSRNTGWWDSKLFMNKHHKVILILLHIWQNRVFWWLFLERGHFVMLPIKRCISLTWFWSGVPTWRRENSETLRDLFLSLVWKKAAMRTPG